MDADRAAKIVRNLLAFVRRSALERSLVDLSELVRSTVTLKTFDFQGSKIELQEDYETELPLVVASREEIRQVILNLISNAEHAVKAVERPGIIRLKTLSEEGFAVVKVSDNGPGIPSEMAGRVFEPFFTTKVVGHGTGLGLSISLGIAEAHGGALTLLDTDRGASFVLKLPIASEPKRPIVIGHAERPTVPLLPEKAGGLVN
jgi:C4-dicarboxylate-specific signal transduction histidine kinase